MGFFSTLFRSKAASFAAPAPVNLGPTGKPIAVAPAGQALVGAGWDDVEVSGESYRRAEIARIFTGLGRPEGGVTMQTAVLVPEPRNPYDKNAVKVMVRGQHVGYVPADDCARVGRACRSLGRGVLVVAPVRIWARNDDGVWRARVTIAFSGSTEEEHDYAKERLEYERYTAEREAARARKSAERVAGEQLKAAQRAAGAVDGQYWVLVKPTISELKRQKRYEDARNLLARCVDAAEREAQVNGAVPNPWPTEQLSVVLRKIHDTAAELALLERYVDACGSGPVPDAVMMRLNRARAAAL